MHPKPTPLSRDGFSCRSFSCCVLYHYLTSASHFWQCTNDIISARPIYPTGGNAQEPPQSTVAAALSVPVNSRTERMPFSRRYAARPSLTFRQTSGS